MYKYRYILARSLFKKETSQRLLQLWRDFEAGRCYHMVQIKRVSLTKKFMICLINKCRCIFLMQIKRNFHDCNEMKYNLDVLT